MYTEAYSPDLLLFTETWLNKSIPDQVVSLGGYNLIRRDRDKGKGGGLIIYYKEGIKIDLSLITPPDCESIGIVWTTNNRKYLIILYYIPPNPSFIVEKAFLGSLDLYWNEYESRDYQDIIYIGDFNLPRIDWRYGTNDYPLDGLGTSFFGFMNRHLLNQHIYNFTRFRGTSSSHLDLLFSVDIESISDLRYCPPFGKSDHVLIEFELEGLVTDAIFSSSYYDFNDMELDKIENSLNNLSLENLFTTKSSFQSDYDSIINYISETIALFVPIRTIFNRGHFRKKLPWISKCSVELCKEKKKLFKIYGKSKSLSDLKIYKNIRNLLSNQLKNDRFVFESNLITQSSKDPNALFKHFKKMKSSDFDKIEGIFN